MSWLFSQALVEDYLGQHFSDGERSARLNGTTMPGMCLSHAKMTEVSKLSRFGTTCKLLTEPLGEMLLMSFLEVFRAKILAVPEKVQELKGQEVPCGSKWQELSVKYDRGLCGWRTAHSLENEVLHWSSVNLPRWGMTVGGVCFQPQKSVHRTNVSESGYSLPTPTCNPELPNKRANTKGPKNLKEVVNGLWDKEFPMLPPPMAHNAKEGGYPAEYTRNTPTLGAHCGGKIHPEFTEWMMGWPIGWTDLKPLETDKYHYARQQHGEF